MFISHISMTPKHDQLLNPIMYFFIIWICDSLGGGVGLVADSDTITIVLEFSI